MSLLVPYSFPTHSLLVPYLPQEPYSFRAICEEAKLGLKKAVETDPRYAKAPRTKKYPPWLISLAKVRSVTLALALALALALPPSRRGASPSPWRMTT